MTKTYCDRCGKEIQESEMSMLTKSNEIVAFFELCPSCLKQLKEWLKGNK